MLTKGVEDGMQKTTREMKNTSALKAAGCMHD